jgi:D-alanine transaminase
MTDLIWLNGAILPMADARISVEDRGLQFADGVYEVIRLYNGRAFALTEHMDRLERSCAGISLTLPMATIELADHIVQFVRKTAVADAMVYLQATRGVAPRNHLFPRCTPTLLFYIRPLPPIPDPGQAPGLKLISVPDERWRRCWIKSVALLANVLAKNAAIAAGADEAAFVENGLVSECSASNLFIVRAATLLTHPVGPRVLPGITRLLLLQLARRMSIPVIERPITEAECLTADEVFITSTTREIDWVARWNDKPVAPGRPGPLTIQLHRALQEKVKRDTA